jgi:hypothetical protein
MGRISNYSFLGILFVVAALTACQPASSASKYDLTRSAKEGKFPVSELDRIVYAVRASVERQYRMGMNTDWQAYWHNAEMFALCGEIQVNDQQEVPSLTPLQPINLKDIVSVELWLEYHGYTPSQAFDNSPDVPIAKTVKATVAYKNDNWEVKAAEESDESICAHCSCVSCSSAPCWYSLPK